ncbi:MAG: glucosylceramidase [Kiritimatiellia bacterium]
MRTLLVLPFLAASILHSADCRISTADRRLQFAPAAVETNDWRAEVRLDANALRQTIDGFGPALTGSSCHNLMRLPTERRRAILKECFGERGWNCVRVSIGCSDFSLDEYTYCDTPGIEHFALTRYETDELFPVLREVLAINPKVRILASPWTCPRWMKVKDLKSLEPYHSWTGGQLNPKHYGDYADYFVRYLQAMQQAGFEVDWLTIQNEPLNRFNSASLFMGWEEQRDFLKQALGPALARAGLKTKVLLWDHNYNYDKVEGQTDYVRRILADPAAARYAAGSAWHAYMNGDKNELLKIHDSAPEKEIHFTEYSSGKWSYPFEKDFMWSMEELGIGCVNRWCRSVVIWNFLLDERCGPKRPKGCQTGIGALTVDFTASGGPSIVRESHYFLLSHLSHAFSPGARILKSPERPIPGVLFCAGLNPDGSCGVAIGNQSTETRLLTVSCQGRQATFRLPPRSFASGRF